MITATALRERLVLVGQDCECDLDREWLRGPLIPARWDESMQQAAVKRLGFDPESPMVRSEVARIVERGPITGQKRKMTGTSQALGYAEESVEGDGAVADERMADGKSSGVKPKPETTGKGLGWAWGTVGVAAMGVVVAAGWILASVRFEQPITPWSYAWRALGGVLLVAWGLRENRSERINLGTALVALTVIAFYFAEVMDKLERSLSLVLLGVLCLAGGWGLEWLRRRMLARLDSLEPEP